MLERSLPRDAYVNDGVWESERELLFARSWVCVGRDDAVGAPAGSYRLVELQGESVLLVRGPDGAVRAFANVCRHRGAELVDTTDAAAATGCFGAVIRCPYHHWTYATDGKLRGAPHVAGELAPEVLAGLALLELPSAAWGGFRFVRQHPEGPSLTEELGPVPARLANYPLAELVVGATLRYEVAANWKVLAENYNECYHCGPVHPELCELVPAFRQGGGDGLDWDHGVPHRPGAYTFTTSGVTDRRPFPGLSPEELVNHKGELVYPNLFVSLSCDHVAAFVLWPEGPARTVVENVFLFHPDEVARDGFDPADAVEFWDTVNRQDWAICERVQRGMTSRHFGTGWYAPMEDPSLDIRRWWTARMEQS